MALWVHGLLLTLLYASLLVGFSPLHLHTHPHTHLQFFQDNFLKKNTVYLLFYDSKRVLLLVCVPCLNVEASRIFSIFDNFFRFLRVLRRQKVHILDKIIKTPKHILNYNFQLSFGGNRMEILFCIQKLSAFS